jgi:hypothetical protein
MRICTQKSSGRFLEMQSDATEGTLIRNAVNAGFNVEDLEEKIITEEEFKEISLTFAVENQPTLTDRILADPTELAKLKAALGL